MAKALSQMPKVYEILFKWCSRFEIHADVIVFSGFSLSNFVIGVIFYWFFWSSKVVLSWENIFLISHEKTKIESNALFLIDFDILLIFSPFSMFVFLFSLWNFFASSTSKAAVDHFSTSMIFD